MTTAKTDNVLRNGVHPSPVISETPMRPAFKTRTHIDLAATPVVIMAGGRGTRLRPFTASFPKPLVPLDDMPILEVVLRQLANQGFCNVTLTLGHLSHLISAYVSTKPWIAKELDIRMVYEDEPTGTAGSLAHVPGLDRTFMAMNGDVLTNIDYGAFLRAHKESGATVTIAAHSKPVKIDLGVLQADDQGRLNGYIEKPVHNYEVSMGIYAYEPRALELIEPGVYLDFPTLIHRLLEAGEPVHVYRTDAFWLDIGRPDDYAQAQEIFRHEPERFGLKAKE